MFYKLNLRWYFLFFLSFLLSCGTSLEPTASASSWKGASSEKKLRFLLKPIKDLNAEIGLYTPTSISKYPKGMLIADNAGQRIHYFNESGDKVFEFGQRGEGPGEFQRPLRVSCSEQEVFVYDLGRMSLFTFSLEGKIKKQEKLTRAASHIYFKQSRFYYGYFHQEGLPDIVIRNQDGTLVKEIVLKGADERTYYPTMAVDEDGQLYAAALNKYEIEVYDRHGNYLHSFGRPYDPLPFVPLPALKLNFGIVPVSAITFNKDYIFVLFGGHQTNYEQYGGKKVSEAHLMRIDVFDRQGKFQTFFWSDEIPKKMAQIHNTPVFHLAENNRLWIQDSQDISEIHIMELVQE